MNNIRHHYDSCWKICNIYYNEAFICKNKVSTEFSIFKKRYRLISGICKKNHTFTNGMLGCGYEEKCE